MVGEGVTEAEAEVMRLGRVRGVVEELRLSSITANSRTVAGRGDREKRPEQGWAT